MGTVAIQVDMRRSGAEKALARLSQTVVRAMGTSNRLDCAWMPERPLSVLSSCRLTGEVAPR
jgi:hypothetical protein